jgi:hypothetical protein
MELSFEQAFIEVWRQALVENAKVVELGADRFHVKDTPKRGLRQVDFVYNKQIYLNRFIPNPRIGKFRPLSSRNDLVCCTCLDCFESVSGDTAHHDKPGGAGP